MNPVKNKQELYTLIKSVQQNIFAFGVLKIAVFGSFVRDEATEDSDVDFFMEFEPEAKTLKNFIGLKNYLQNLLGRKVEIITPQSLNEFIGKYILKEIEYVAIAA
jgi:predicted nucleotidyltransferase